MSDPLNPMPADGTAQQPYANPQPHAPEGSDTAWAAPQQSPFGAPTQAQQPQFAQPGGNQYVQNGQGAQGVYGQPLYGQPMYAPSAGKDFSNIQIGSFVAMGAAVFSWVLFSLLLSIPAMIAAIVLNVKAKREGAPQNIVKTSMIAMIVSIVMVVLQTAGLVAFVAFALLGDL